MPYGVVLKDERRTSNIERPTSNKKTTTQHRTFNHVKVWFRFSGFDIRRIYRTQFPSLTPSIGGRIMECRRSCVERGWNTGFLQLPFFYIICLFLHLLPFNVRCWTFDVRCSFFQYLLIKNNLVFIPLLLRL